MRFILNFIFFGILFYLIWTFFPDAFLTLVSWADHIVTFFKDLIMGVADKVQHGKPSVPVGPPTPVVPHAAWLMYMLFHK